MKTTGDVVGGKYRLDGEIGSGGMGVIWRATHIHLDRPVAIKYLTFAAERTRMLERFLVEAKAAASVRHRNVIDIIDFGTDDGQPYMVMELLEGRTLGDAFDPGEGALSTAGLVRVIGLALGGLAAVHDAGIVHRDIKPENVFLVRDADGIFPKLLDFGISRTTGRADGPRVAHITQEGVIRGTPQYMSPEQARGLRDIDLRSDLWAMGVMLYEGLTSHQPFDHDNPVDVLLQIVRDEPVPLGLLRPDLPDALVEVVERAMAKNREHRFQDARSMRDALAAAGRALEEPVELRRSVPEAREQPREVPSFRPAPVVRRRSRASVAVALVALIAAAAFAGWIATHPLEGAHERAAAVPPAPPPPPIAAPADPPRAIDAPVRAGAEAGREVAGVQAPRPQARPIRRRSARTKARPRPTRGGVFRAPDF